MSWSSAQRWWACALLALLACGRPEKLQPADAGAIIPLPTGGCIDNDGDGVAGTGDCAGEAAVDCNDAEPTVRPGAPEQCNQLDDNCDGRVDEGLTVSPYYADADGDGVGATAKLGEGCSLPPAGQVTVGGDCDDGNAAIRPGVAELCNGVDDDCDQQVDNGVPFQDFYPDQDGDGFGDANGAKVSACQATVQGRVANRADCRDSDPTVKPGAGELCNKVDDNCDGQVDNGITFQDYYPDQDGDGFGAAGAPSESSCAPIPGKVTSSSDCNDANPGAKPGAPEVCNGADDDCNGQVDEGLAFASYYLDVDGDGYGAQGATAVSACAPQPGQVTNRLDCNDGSPMVKPGAPELCNGVDDDCSGVADDGLTFQSYFADADGDGFGAGPAQAACAPIPGRVTNGADCNDGNPSVKPGAPEVCNGADDNCVGGADEDLSFADYSPDADGDGFGNAVAPVQRACLPVPGKVTNRLDCDDALFAVKPGAPEVCNGRDDDCDGAADQGLTFSLYYPDLDGDGRGSASAAPLRLCASGPGQVLSNDDCNDGNASVRPGAVETCNGVDDNCDGQIDNGTVTQSYYPDADGDGYGSATGLAQVSCAPVPFRAPNNLDCDDANAAIRPLAVELCNGVDDNCAGGVDEGLTVLAYYPDLDGDGFGALAAQAQLSCAAVPGKVSSNTDCNDANAQVRPGAAEVCNGADDNCVGGADEGLPTSSWYPDGDLDGFGALGSTALASCGAVPGRVTNSSDCDDGNVAVRPGVPEACNQVDDNCSGQVDEGNPGGGAGCSTGQAGVCGPGTVTCSAGALTCVRNRGPSTEVCDGLDNNCTGGVDEGFAGLGAACSAGLGVCRRSGTSVCSSDTLSVVCSVSPGAPTAAACDGLDNDCDGVVDEPFLSSTADLATSTAWADVEVAPYFFSGASCAGGANGTGSDALVGGALAMAGGAGGFYFQPLSAAGAPTVAPTAAASSLSYSDVALAQAGDAFVIAGLYLNASNVPIEIDLNLMDAATGARRALRWSLFNTGRALDSLRVVRGNGRRVVLLWREATVGFKLSRVEACFDGTTWTLQAPGCTGAAPAAVLLSTAANAPAGLGADSSHVDWAATQSCASAASLRRLGLAYRGTSTEVRQFTLNEDGTGKSAEAVVYSVSSPRVLDEPELAYFQSAGADAWAVAYITRNSGAVPPNADLGYWLSSNPGWRYAYLEYASVSGVSSIARPRLSVTLSAIWMSALRQVVDASGFSAQVMTRVSDLSGAKVPDTSSVELSATSGGCAGQGAACRPGNKAAFTQWAPFGRLYYSASGSTPTGTFASTLSCQ